MDVGLFFQAEDGIRDLVRSRGLGDVYKRQTHGRRWGSISILARLGWPVPDREAGIAWRVRSKICLLYTSDAADERSSVDLGGRRIIKKKKKYDMCEVEAIIENVSQCNRR